MNKLDHLIKVLDREFPDPKVELRYKTPLELLIATILSAQCTDERVNKVTPHLFKKYKSAKDYAGADPAVLEQEVRSTGFYKNKAKNMIRCCQVLVEKHAGRVPQTMEELTALPGVGRKTANVLLGNSFGRPAIVVDTHVRRVSQRLGLTRSDDPDEIETELGRFIPEKKWSRVSLQLLLHGRYRCTAKKPDCPDCDLKPICSYFKQNGGAA
ncbi:MAG TPA: endonuclease III [Nitrospiria bacterium]|nr:endonuclease III [Nitrospiria bacterium]